MENTNWLRNILRHFPQSYQIILESNNTKHKTQHHPKKIKNQKSRNPTTWQINFSTETIPDIARPTVHLGHLSSYQRQTPNLVLPRAGFVPSILSLQSPTRPTQHLALLTSWPIKLGRVPRHTFSAWPTGGLSLLVATASLEEESGVQEWDGRSIMILGWGKRSSLGVPDEGRRRGTPSRSCLHYWSQDVFCYHVLNGWIQGQVDHVGEWNRSTDQLISPFFLLFSFLFVWKSWIDANG